MVYSLDIEGRVCCVELNSRPRSETSHEVDIRTLKDLNMTMTEMD